MSNRGVTSRLGPGISDKSFNKLEGFWYEIADMLDCSGARLQLPIAMSKFCSRSES